ncbi:MAG: phospho-N-acetylmuramoyl-pentapeptide-transferase, partial [Kiritimatiellales bacterium]|nr:phospho-N-acetylmuramoyl-pentapeptide-transferase [Kiritimatiellales bacterium]
MFYYLTELEGLFSPLRLFQYITFRTLGAASTAFILSLLIAPDLIRRLRIVNFGEQQTDERVEGLDKRKKVGTPTMGGLMIIIAAAVATLLWAIPTNLYIMLTLATFCLMGLIGFGDDYLKIKRRNGLSVKMKFTAQLIWALIVFTVLWSIPDMQERVRDLMVPFFKRPVLDMGLVGSFVFLVIVLVGASNAVNLTDGLDGLAIGCSNSVAVAYLFLT